mgnify:CR=1 FL=1
MARYGRRTVKIDAPIMITTNKIAVWKDQGEWMCNFFAWCKENNFTITGFAHLQGKLKVSFLTAKECTLFVLKYAGRKK